MLLKRRKNSKEKKDTIIPEVLTYKEIKSNFLKEIGEELINNSPLYKLEQHSGKNIYLLIKGFYIKIEINQINYSDNLVELNIENSKTLQNLKKTVGDVKIEIEEGVFNGKLVNEKNKCYFKIHNFISFSSEERNNQKRECSRLELLAGEDIEKLKKIIFGENELHKFAEIKLENGEKGEICDLSTKGVGFILPKEERDDKYKYYKKEINVSMDILGEEISLPVIIKSVEPTYKEGIVKIGGNFNYKEDNEFEKDHIYRLLVILERKLIQELKALE